MPTLFFKIKRKIYKLFHPAWGEILILHRVVHKRSQLKANRQMEVTLEFLEKTILAYKTKGYRFVSLDEVHEIVSEQRRLKQQFVCFTFDDGYADNYELAYPVFKKYNCPFAIYVTTDFPDGKALLWWYVLEDLLMSNTELKLGDGSCYDCSTIEKKSRTFDAVRQKIFNFPAENMVQQLNQLFGNYSYSFDDKNTELALDWEQIETLAKNDLCTIASHTVSHRVLSNMSLEDVAVELRDSKYQLEKHIHKPVVHFAYPYGLYSETVIQQVRLAGFKTAVLANGGKVRKSADRLKLKRLN